ncbi:MAG: ATP-binding cassette domain-containing protein [Firmicutes bacterium]|nr:ATP-binding cassette domain-containing protein [Bacillota bacterium]
MAALIEVEDLHFRYHDGTPALQGITLKIDQGEKVAILGPNGAGKSTLLLHLNGIYHAQQGVVRVAGEKITRANENWVRGKVGLVFQDPDDQVFSPTVWDDVAFGPLNQGLDRTTVEARVMEALRAVGMWDLRARAPHHLSYGQKKRVAIAGILAMNPEIIILDEPTAFLDPAGQRALFEILEKLHARGKTIIIATHDVDLAAEWATSVIFLKEGKLLAQGDTSLLVEDSLVREADLRHPIVSQVFRQVPALVIRPLPKTVAEGAHLIAQLVGEKERRRGFYIIS